jgi:RsmE family RNA methyltransferase
MQRHEFAFFVTEPLVPSHLLVNITDKLLYHRIVHIVRLIVGSTLVLFDKNIIIHGEIVALQASSIQIYVRSLSATTPLQPEIHWILPVLDRVLLEEALYSLTAVGVSSIYLADARKVHRAHITEKEYARLQRIMVAAAEQSKQFYLPVLHQVQPLQAVLVASMAQYPQAERICFDMTGGAIGSLLTDLYKKNPSHLLVVSGPEGDFVELEKIDIMAKGFKSYRLTSTVLTSSHAVIIGAGIIRSVI